MKKYLTVLFVLLVSMCVVFGQAIMEARQAEEETIVFVDSCQRSVEFPAKVSKVAPSGAVATMMISVIAPEYMCNVNSSPSAAQMEYLPAVLATLPATGQLYGSKATLNLEELLATGAQVLVDLGDYKKGIAEDLDALQSQINTPCIFLEADLLHMADAFRSLGSILEGKEERGEAIAAFIDKTMAMCAENAAKVKDDERISVMYTSGTDGLGTNARGSSQAQVIELVGAENAIVVDNPTSKGGGNQINMEMLYNFDPDVILFSAGSIYSTVADDPAWKELSAVKNGSYYEIPDVPYNWMSNPPSINMVIGIWWLGNLLYPQYFDYDIASVVKEFYSLFWGYELTDEQVNAFLAR